MPARYLKAQAGYDKAVTLIAYIPSCAFTSLVKRKNPKNMECFFSGSPQKQLAINEFIFRGGRVNKVMGRTRTGFIEVYVQSLSACCDLDL